MSRVHEKASGIPGSRFRLALYGQSKTVLLRDSVAGLPAYHLGMKTKVIVANELRYYREILARAILAARPEAQVTVVAPAFLEKEVRRLEPDLVVCSCAGPAVEAGTRAWVELYPDHGPVSMVCVDGRRSPVQDMELDDLLRFMDRLPARGRGAPDVEHEIPGGVLGS